MSKNECWKSTSTYTMVARPLNYVELQLHFPCPPAMIYDVLDGYCPSGSSSKGPHHVLPPSFCCRIILPNQSYPLHKVIPISKNRRYHNSPKARELFCSVPTWSVLKGSTQLSKGNVQHSSHLRPSIYDIETDNNPSYWGLHNIPRTQLPNALI